MVVGLDFDEVVVGVVGCRGRGQQGGIKGAGGFGGDGS